MNNADCIIYGLGYIGLPTSVYLSTKEISVYGVDINPLAVELAKLAIWLVTLSEGRPFGFLDHNLKSGNSLFGIHNIDQLYFCAY